LNKWIPPLTLRRFAQYLTFLRECQSPFSGPCSTQVAAAIRMIWQDPRWMALSLSPKYCSLLGDRESLYASHSLHRDKEYSCQTEAYSHMHSAFTHQIISHRTWMLSGVLWRKGDLWRRRSNWSAGTCGTHYSSSLNHATHPIPF
jgi:hypothetical protein